MNKNINMQKGITLIALVITIIVLLILAGVTINMVLGEDGIIKQAQDAKFAQKFAAVEEQVRILAGELEVSNYGGTEPSATSAEDFIDSLVTDKIISDETEVTYADAENKFSVKQADGAFKEIDIEVSFAEGPYPALGKYESEVYEKYYVENGKDGVIIENGCLYPEDSTVVYDEETGEYRNVFYEAIDGKVLVIPNGITEFGSTDTGWLDIFYDGSNYGEPEAVILPNSMVSANMCYCQMKEIVVPNSVKEISFSYCFRLESVDLPNSLEEIPSHCFDACWELAELTIPSTVTKIGDYAFLDCYNLEEITIPSSVTEMGEGVFARCDGLTKIYVESGSSLTYEDIAENGYYEDDMIPEDGYYFPEDCEVICPDWD